MYTLNDTKYILITFWQIACLAGVNNKPINRAATLRAAVLSHKKVFFEALRTIGACTPTKST